MKFSARLADRCKPVSWHMKFLLMRPTACGATRTRSIRGWTSPGYWITWKRDGAAFKLRGRIDATYAASKKNDVQQVEYLHPPASTAAASKRSGPPLYTKSMLFTVGVPFAASVSSKLKPGSGNLCSRSVSLDRPSLTGRLHC